MAESDKVIRDIPVEPAHSDQTLHYLKEINRQLKPIKTVADIWLFFFALSLLGIILWLVLLGSYAIMSAF
ncbi:MAG TPA: hypothetical protein PK607_16860 [Aggregatilineales bacterium]|nr:hypothetical protein [Aggregatilineales bacterium]